MTAHTNLNDIGWMCHVIPLRKNKEPAFMPPISQIPNIGCMPEDTYPTEEPKSIFKSTDSPVVRLAKLGGRPDLLCFKENEPNKGPPLPYCRCDWFYLEDNALEDQINKEKEQQKNKHVFKVPFYMTHKEYKPKEELCKPITQSTPPLITPPRKVKKCGKLPPHRPGYAEYNRKPFKVGIAKQIFVQNEPIRFPKSDVTECNPTTVPKLLANSYVSDYSSYRKQWNEVANYYKDKPACKLEKNIPKPGRKSLGPKHNDLTF